MNRRQARFEFWSQPIYQNPAVVIEQELDDQIAQKVFQLLVYIHSTQISGLI
jgi:hypothetical protein